MSYCRGEPFNAQRHSIASVPALPLSAAFCSVYSCLRSVVLSAMVGFHTHFIFAHHGKSIAAFRSTNEQTMWYPTYRFVEVFALLLSWLFCVNFISHPVRISNHPGTVVSFIPIYLILTSSTLSIFVYCVVFGQTLCCVFLNINISR